MTKDELTAAFKDVGGMAGIYADKLADSIDPLLQNGADTGTVQRALTEAKWPAALVSQVGKVIDRLRSGQPAPLPAHGVPAVKTTEQNPPASAYLPSGPYTRGGWSSLGYGQGPNRR